MNPAMRSAVLLASALLIAWAAVAPAMDSLADKSFAWHMAQHLVLVYPVALLLLLARPLDLYARFASKTAVAQLVGVLRPLHALAWPPAALAIFIGVLWATHFSPLYELALERPWLHAGEHLLYLAAGCIFWLPVVAPPPLRPLPYPARLLYLIVALPQGALLGMVIASARQPLYAHYAAQVGSRALADQNNAAAVMWIAGGLAIFTALLVTLAVWASREQEQRHPERSRGTARRNLTA